MDTIPEEKILAIGSVLKNTNRPLKERFRALFTLRNLGGPVSVKCIEQCFDDSSALLKHELAYCLGQMGDQAAIPVLTSVLKDTSQEPMVRHEAAEALGAIGSEESLDVLLKHLDDPVPEVAETCELAIERIKWHNNEHKDTERKSPYASVDPTPPAEESDVEMLEKVLLDEKASLFNRYKAMFALRNLQTAESLFSKGSALFRHEVAFVLGQMQNEVSVPYLKKSLEDPSENEMVRHECAEALGAIATEDCCTILKNFLEDEKRVVKESCEIALDMCDYENSPEFQYANTLLRV
ncbi:Deoxyhypusine hydroxylase [Gryllus bimaculatus]|nr:Deoxyhypusine hydroxylase [Gryllus bimaculatus]